MFPKENRLNLRKRPNFFNQAQRYYSPLFTIHYQQAEVKTQTQAAVVVKKKDVKKAVERNRLKRMARSALKRLLEKNKKIELVLVLKKKGIESSLEELEQEIEKFYSWKFGAE